MSSLKTDVKELNQLAADIEKAQKRLLGRAAERSYQLLRDEVPKQTTNLQQGVAPPDVDYEKLQASLTVSARSARTGSGTATVHLKDGKTKQVKLRPQKEYNYADVIARGNKDAVLSPKKAKAFLIPISGPAEEGTLEIDGKVYVLRKTKKGMKPNPFDERAAVRLENEAPNIADAILRQLFQ